MKHILYSFWQRIFWLLIYARHKTYRNGDTPKRWIVTPCHMHRLLTHKKKRKQMTNHIKYICTILNYWHGCSNHTARCPFLDVILLFFFSFVFIFFCSVLFCEVSLPLSLSLGLRHYSIFSIYVFICLCVCNMYALMNVFEHPASTVWYKLVMHQNWIQNNQIYYNVTFNTNEAALSLPLCVYSHAAVGQCRWTESCLLLLMFFFDAIVCFVLYISSLEISENNRNKQLNMNFNGKMAISRFGFHLLFLRISVQSNRNREYFVNLKFV